VPDALLRAGGLAPWQAPPVDPAADIRLQRETSLWRWLKGYAEAKTELAPLYVGYGTADRFAASNGLLAAALPSSHVFTTEGGHAWGPWLRLWTTMLPRLPLPRCPR
jgi:hypothetical protein